MSVQLSYTCDATFKDVADKICYPEKCIPKKEKKMGRRTTRQESGRSHLYICQPNVSISQDESQRWHSLGQKTATEERDALEKS